MLEQMLEQVKNLGATGLQGGHEFGEPGVECYSLPKIPTLKPNPQSVGIKRWGLWEVNRS